MQKYLGARTARQMALVAITATAAFTAMAATPTNYAGIQLGRNDLRGWPARVDFGAGIGVDGSLGLSRGGHAGAVFGREGEHWRLEVEYQAGRAKVTSASLGPASQAADASLRYQALTANAYGTAALTQRLAVYAAAGLGVGSVSMPQLGTVSGCNCFSSASRSGTVYLLRAGGEYNLSANDHLFLQYTSLRLPGASASATPSVSYPHRSVGIVGIGYRRTF